MTQFTGEFAMKEPAESLLERYEPKDTMTSSRLSRGDMALYVRTNTCEPSPTG